MYIKGVGMTEFGIQQDSAIQMIQEAVAEALDDSNISMEEIDAIVLSNIDILSNGERQRHSASMISSLFKKKVSIITMLAGCAGGGTALWTAIKLQKTQNHKNILVLGFEKIVANVNKRITDEILMGTERIYEQNEGMNFPAENALIMQQYMMMHGATTDDFSLVALKNHENAFLNPRARFYKTKISLEMIKKSPIVASPLRLFDCSIPANGAAALILSKDETDIKIVGSSQQNDCLAPFEREDMTSWEATRIAAQDAYKQAGISPSDLDIAEVHDAFTSVEMISYEDLGFCKKGEAKDLVRKGETNIDGKLPVNTSGGLKAKGHPISATGVSQIYEIAKQMRNQCGKRQIDGVKHALAQNIGGAGSTVVVHILKKYK